MTIPLMPLIESIDNFHTTVFYWKPKFEDEKKNPQNKQTNTWTKQEFFSNYGRRTNSTMI